MRSYRAGLQGLLALSMVVGTLASLGYSFYGDKQFKAALPPLREARRDGLASQVETYRVLHFATHGVADPQRPEGSGLLLSAPEVAKLRLSCWGR